MSIDTLKDARKVVGAKQTAKAVEKGQASLVFLAEDAESRVILPLREACFRAGVTVRTVPTMIELGKACGIEVGAAAVAVIRV
ncbi:MAG TPA: ribosomal L7Ae/L30e/S12e/Gadd45 family protein [Negativicutes bacterium]|nr:ribosomal L7Ae/L30e/S12e/Gadd45 family protein [Negativicutes bacterium]